MLGLTVEAVKRAEEALFVRSGVIQDRAAQRGRQGQRHHHGEEHRRNNGDRELTVNDPGRAAEEGHRQEYRREHQRNGDQRAGNFAHRFFGRFPGGQPFVAHNTLDVFHHHDGVIHQKSYRQHHGKQRQGVDGVTEQRQHTEGAQQNHRHRQRRDQRCADVLQKQVHHHHHEDNGFEQGLNHVLNGDLDELGAVFRVGHVVAFRHRLFELGDLVFYRRGGVKRVGARREHHRHTRRRVAVQLRGGGVIFAAHLHARDVADAHHRTVGLALDDDLFELIDRLQTRLSADGGGQLLGVRRGQCADFTGGNLHVLRFNRALHVGGHQRVRRQLRRVEPDAHRVFCTEHL